MACIAVVDQQHVPEHISPDKTVDALIFFIQSQTQGRGPEPARCVHTARFEGVTRGERATGRS